MSEDITEDEIRERVSGEQLIHRLRQWEDGDTAYCVTTFAEGGSGSTGKSYREGSETRVDAESAAREMYERDASFKSGLTVLYRGTVRNPETEPRGPDPGEPPLKTGTLTDVEILDWKQNSGDAE